MTSSNVLSEFLDQDTQRPCPKIARRLADHIRAQFLNPDGINAIVLYGSGLWGGEDAETIWDLYVLVDGYGDSTRNPFLHGAGSILAPNVYYIDDPARCKYAVMRMDQFERGAAGKTISPQIWARFSQPCRILYTRDDATKKRILKALSDALVTFHSKTLPLVEGKADTKDIWGAGLRATYGAELRSEDTGRADAIYEAAPENFSKRTELVLPFVKKPRAVPFYMRPLTKIVNFLRLIKATLTFSGGVDYALWKVERHSGVRVEVSDFQRKYPLIGAWPLVWEIYRKGGFK